MKLRLIAMVVCGAYCAAIDFARGADAEDTLPRDARAELARELFAPVSFNIGDYFFIQEDLKKYISGLSVNNAAWDELKRYHDRRDYLGMLGVLNMEKLREYPSEETIRRLYAELVGNAGMTRIGHFTLSISLTRNIPLACRSFNGKTTGHWIRSGDLNNQGLFVIKAGKCFYIYSPDSRINDLIKVYSDARDKVREDMKMARIFKEDGEKKIADLCERQYNDTLRWLATAKVIAGEPIAGRVPLQPSFWRTFNGERKKGAASEKSESAGTNGPDKSNSDQSGEFVVCEKCKGRKTVPNEVICSKCNGAGSFVRQTRIKDLSGNALPPREVKCSKCNGKGVISVGRKPCEACDGKGRVPR